MENLGSRESGTIGWFNEVLKSGGIIPAGGGPDIVFQKSNFRLDRSTSINVGASVEYDVVTDISGVSEACHVTLVGGEYVNEGSEIEEGAGEGYAGGTHVPGAFRIVDGAHPGKQILEYFYRLSQYGRTASHPNGEVGHGDGGGGFFGYGDGRDVKHRSCGDGSGEVTIEENSEFDLCYRCGENGHKARYCTAEEGHGGAGWRGNGRYYGR